MGNQGSDFSELLTQAQGVQDFLGLAVVEVARRVDCDACSVFLYDSVSERLTLRATQGLGPQAVGLSLGLDEGLVGKALREERPILATQPTQHPQFRLFSEVPEDEFQSFLALPLVRGGAPLGVVTLHDRRPEGFGEAVLKRLRDLAAALGNVLGDAQMVFDVGQTSPRPMTSVAATPITLIRGRASSEGIALGQVVVFDDDAGTAYLTLPSDVEFWEDLPGFRTALERSVNQVDELQKETEQTLSDVAGLIFSTHLLMLKDESFSGAMEALVVAGTPAPAAVVQVVNQYVDVLGRSPSPLLQEKAQDVKDLGHRLLRNLRVVQGPEGDYSGQVVVAQELLPSELVKIAAQHAEGILLLGGGASAHVSILAKSLDIPVLFTEDRALLGLREGDFLVLDGFEGLVYVNPDAELIARFRRADDQRKLLEDEVRSAHETTVTADGVVVKLLANINLLSDLAVARRVGAEGVGLYRSEFPFLIRSDFPTEDEQYDVYRRLLDEMPGREVVLRTLDIGGDKVLSYLPQAREDNPFLGLRAIRFSLSHPDLFHDQLRALLRAGRGHELRILFPLISSVDDFLQARAHVEACIAELADAGVGHNPRPLLGAMIELPSACEVAPELAREADFLCLGTNDLVQYLLGVDRTNEAVANLYTAQHPAVYRTLARVIAAALAAGKSISVCGEIAADPVMIPFLIGVGIRKLSANPRLLPQVQATIEALDVGRCRADAQTLLSLGTLAEIHGFLTNNLAISP